MTNEQEDRMVCALEIIASWVPYICWNIVIIGSGIVLVLLFRL